jgi:hypothetical protein
MLSGEWFPRISLLVILVCFALWFATQARKPLQGGPLNIIVLELAPTIDAANRFMSAWQAATPNWQWRLREAQQWDTWLICTYAPLFTLLCWLTSDTLSDRWPTFGAFGQILAIGQLLAGVLDLIENWGLQKTIDAGHAYGLWPLITASASVPKWLLLLAFGLYLLVAAVLAATRFLARL